MKNNKQKLRNLADKLRSLIVRSRGRCEMCGSKNNLQDHHVVEKSRSTYLRYDLENSLCLCMGCHMKWHHMGVLAAGDWFMKKYGQARWDYLIAHQQDYVNANVSFYRSAVERLTELLASASPKTPPST